MSHAVGSAFQATFAVYDTDSVLTDPTEITLTITLPDQTTVTPTPVHDSMGTYHYDYTFAAEGLHKFSWLAIDPAAQKTDYANAAEWRSVIGIDEAKDFVHFGTGDDESILLQILAAATELAEGIVGICVPKRYVNQRVPGTDRAVIRLPNAPLLSDQSIESITSVWTGGPSWVTADLIAYPDSATCESADMIPFWLGPWKATYTAGRTVISESIQLAVKEIILDLWAMHRPYGADELEPGPEATARWEQMLASYQIPPHAKVLLEAEELPGFA